MKGEFSNRLVQVSLFAGIVYYITAYPVVFESARKYFPIKFKKTHHLLIFHTFVFAVLMCVLTYFVFDPIVKVVEGAETQGTQGTIKDSIFNSIIRFEDYLMHVSKLAKQEGQAAAPALRDCWNTTKPLTFGNVADCIRTKLEQGPTNTQESAASEGPKEKVPPV